MYVARTTRIHIHAYCCGITTTTTRESTPLYLDLPLPNWHLKRVISDHMKPIQRNHCWLLPLCNSHLYEAVIAPDSSRVFVFATATVVSEMPISVARSLFNSSHLLVRISPFSNTQLRTLRHTIVSLRIIMFNNYQELFSDYAELYRGSFFFSSIPDVGQFQENFAGPPAGHNESILYGGVKIISHQEPKNQRVIGTIYTLFKHLGQTDIDLNEITPGIGSRQTNGHGETITIGSFNGISVRDVAYVLLVFGFLIVAKKYLSARLRSSEYLKQLQLKPKDRERFDECLWRLLFYSFSSTCLVYTCFLKHQAQRYFNPNRTIADYSFDLDWDEYGICIVETAFYLHATYAILFEDVMRKDTAMMFIHHVAAIFGVTSLYATRTHRIGLATMVLRDTCDVLLEITKMGMCLRVQRGKVIKSIEHLIKTSFLVFTVAFAVNQLYYYPLFCLYHAFNIMKIFHVRSTIYTGILTCGLIFLLLDMLWFVLIIRLLFRLLVTSKVDDLREYDSDDTSSTIATSDKKHD